ncbi:MAG: adenylosuccinate synthase [Elusimicrobia bacterium]|nr:adenylosuccinate synthase [Elusimicrobiota bacterium]
MPALVVVGAQWGDEGKGKIVHFLGEGADWVVRYQGGDNAGHTVVFDGQSYALHLLPSGILQPGVKNIIGSGVVVNPSALAEEVAALESRGVRVRGRLFLSLAAHVILPYHIHLDVLREAGGRGLGTTKKGIGPCYEDKVARIGVRVADYLDRAALRSLVRQALAVRAAELAKVKPLQAIEAEVFDGYEERRRLLARFAADTGPLLDRALRAGKRVLLESAQGSMLDLDHGTYPFVTSSNPVAGGACVGAGVGPTVITGVMGVTKAYTTRVGRGPFPTEIPGALAGRIREIGKEYGVTTGRARRIGWLDVPQLRAAARMSGLTCLAMTKLDTLSGVGPIKICVGYRLDGRLLRDFPVSRRAQREVRPVYRSFPGFSGDLGRVRSLSDLPRAAREYVFSVERLLGVPVAVVSVGQSREQTIVRDAAGIWGRRHSI